MSAAVASLRFTGVGSANGLNDSTLRCGEFFSLWAA